MKILAIDRELAEQFRVSAYGVAQARELRELANCDHPLAVEAKTASEAVFRGTLGLGEAYKLVLRAKVETGRALLSAQIDAQLLANLKALAKERKQLFKDMVEEMAQLYYIVVMRDQTNGVNDSGTNGQE